MTVRVWLSPYGARSRERAGSQSTWRACLLSCLPIARELPSSPGLDPGDALLAAGVYYARSDAGASSCSAGTALQSPGQVHWGYTLAAAGVVG